MDELEKWEVLGRCSCCTRPIRTREYRTVLLPGDEDPGFVAEHITYKGMSICADCLRNYPFPWAVINALGLNTLIGRSFN